VRTRSSRSEQFQRGFFQVEAEAEQRLAEQAAVLAEQGDKAVAEAVNAIEEKVGWYRTGRGRRSAAGVLVEESFKDGQTEFHFLGRGRDKTRVAGAGAADPFPAAPRLAGKLSLARPLDIR